MLTARIESEKFKFNLPINIVLAKVDRANLHHVPYKASATCCPGLRLIDWRNLRWTDVFVNNEKDLAAHILEVRCFWRKHDQFLV
jgi:hypothetical protein